MGSFDANAAFKDRALRIFDADIYGKEIPAFKSYNPAFIAT